MNGAGSTDRESLGPDFPGPVTQVLMQLLYPTARREEFVGDLIEEAETVVLPARGRRAARRWFRWQLAESIPPLLTRHLEREIQVGNLRWGTAAAILALGTVMVSDSGLWTGSIAAIVFGLLAVVVPAVVGLISGNLVLRGMAVILSTALLIAVRGLSGIELRWYAMGWVFFVLLIGWNLEHRPFFTLGRRDHAR